MCGRGENPRQAASDTEDGEANDAYFEADDHGRTASTSPRRGVHQGSSPPHAIVCLFRSTFTPLHSIPLHSPLHYTPHSVTLVHLTSLTSLRARAMMWKMYCVWPPTSPMHRTPEPSGSVAVVPATYTATPKQRGGKNQKHFFFFLTAPKEGTPRNRMFSSTLTEFWFDNSPQPQKAHQDDPQIYTWYVQRKAVCMVRWMFRTLPRVEDNFNLLPKNHGCP